MTTLIALVIAVRAKAPVINLPSLLGAPDAKVVKMLGPKKIFKRDPFAFFYPKGLSHVEIDATGPTMSNVLIYFSDSSSWQDCLQELALTAGGVAATSEPLPRPAIPLIKDRFTLVGVKGLGLNPKSHKPWHIIYELDAVVNKDRTRALRPKILASTGEGHLALIRQCYDWRALLHFSY